jgi:Kef-type K+ transport system membrane component KefB
VTDLSYLLVLAGLMHAVRSFTTGPDVQVGTSLAFGYLILTALLAGRVFERLRLPRLTGYLAAGVVVGPGVAGLVSEAATTNLRIVNGVAIALIAATAGADLDLRRIRPLLRTIVWALGVGSALAWAALCLALLALRGRLPFLAELEGTQAVAVAVLLAVVLVAQSPAVVVALADELRADGPVTRSALGMVVIADLGVIVLFAIASVVAKATLGGATAIAETALRMAWELPGSFVAGGLLAALLTAQFRLVRRGTALFVIASAFVVAEAGGVVGLDPLLVALTAGVVVRNLTPHGDELRAAISAAAPPVYVTFFAVAGATLHLGALASAAVAVIVLVVVRGAALLLGGRAGARMGGAPPLVARLAPYGLLPQAGLALALALLFASSFPELGETAAALVLGVVGVNELVAPVLYRWALVRSGEAGRAAPAEAAAPSTQRA